MVGRDELQQVNQQVTRLAATEERLHLRSGERKHLRPPELLARKVLSHACIERCLDCHHRLTDCILSFLDVDEGPREDVADGDLYDVQPQMQDVSAGAVVREDGRAAIVLPQVFAREGLIECSTLSLIHHLVACALRFDLSFAKRLCAQPQYNG